MLGLIQNEWMKIFRRPGTYVMIGLLLVMTTVAGAFIKYQESGGTVPDNTEWKRGLQTQNESYQKQLEEMGEMAPRDMKEQYQREIALNEYRINNDISPNQEYSVWGFVSDTSQLIEFAGLFTIIIAGGIVASEFTWGTIKLLLIRPIKRIKVLGAKYITVILFGLLVLAVLFGYSAILGSLLFGFPEKAIPYLYYYKGTVKEVSMGLHLISYYGLKSINVLMLATMAFMISAVFRNSSLAIGLSLFLMFMGGQVTRLIAMKYDWAKYSLFANTDLLQYFEGVPMVQEMTLGFSIIMIVVYFLLFQALAFYVFNKRDVSA
ncbi:MULTISPECIES: ABC transporter permease [unclassified Cytobacillus]|uniref:ABC transporter permease n=1 Tax=unclassified Cytobacillus TaxID=2675268 RepID=UPI001358EBBA|nr:ABC transporter permease [Cytobacillus sp. AMY 15.2]KAF0819313.1 ABC transporter permease YhcI [Bacillus sp. ZZV12-4809]MCM3091346.1 ABC transporter permease [Cytobacillus sp. AMY 15.2]